MYEYLSGRLVSKAPTHVILDVSGIGYYIHITLTTYSQLKDQEECKLYTSFQVREDSHTLYGFASAGERHLFEHLISVPGIGPSTGRMMLSSSTPEELQSAIIHGEVNTMRKIKGIGPKTAQRLILELQDKLKKNGDDALIPTITLSQKSAVDEALSALIMLGFSKQAAEKVLNGIYSQSPELNVEELIKASLKKL